MRLLRRRPPESAALPAGDVYVLGQPTPCPLCAGDGYLDRINIVNETQSQHCKRCDFRWSTDARGELVARD